MFNEREREERVKEGVGDNADLYVAGRYEEEISHCGCCKYVPRERFRDRFIVLKYHLSPLNFLLSDRPQSIEVFRI